MHNQSQNLNDAKQAQFSMNIQSISNPVKANSSLKKANKTLKRMEYSLLEQTKILNNEQQQSKEYKGLLKQQQHQRIIQKLMNAKKQKPNIGYIQRSPLFRQLETIMPILKKSNEQIILSGVNDDDRIDARLQKVQSSSSSSQDEEHTQKTTRQIDMQYIPQLDYSNQQPIKAKKSGVGSIKLKKPKQQQMKDESCQEAHLTKMVQNHIELNFLKYQIPQSNEPSAIEPTKTKPAKAKPFIVQL